MISSKFLLAWLLRLKNPAILTGILYVIAFFLLLPYLVQLHLPVNDALIVLFGTLLAVAVVTALLNWAYLATMAIPMAAALVFFFLGWIVYIVSPGIDAIGQIVIGILNGFIANFGASGAVGNVTTAFQDFSKIGEHIGQFMITIGTGIYIHGKVWAGKINYVAVGTFITIFALLGVALGFTGLSGVAIFLVIWLMFYMRMQGSSSGETIADMRILFKVVATIVVLIGSGVIHLSTSLFSDMQGMGNFGGFVSPVDSSNTFSDIWNYFWSIALLVGVWKPSLLWKLVPNKYLGIVRDLLSLSGSSEGEKRD